MGKYKIYVKIDGKYEQVVTELTASKMIGYSRTYIPRLSLEGKLERITTELRVYVTMRSVLNFIKKYKNEKTDK